LSFRISGKNLDVGEALRGRIEARIAEALRITGRASRRRDPRDRTGARQRTFVETQNGTLSGGQGEHNPRPDAH
jgi:hypothetical protein